MDSQPSDSPSCEVLPDASEFDRLPQLIGVFAGVFSRDKRWICFRYWSADDRTCLDFDDLEVRLAKCQPLASGSEETILAADTEIEKACGISRRHFVASAGDLEKLEEIGIFDEWCRLFVHPLQSRAGS